MLIWMEERQLMEGSGRLSWDKLAWVTSVLVLREDIISNISRKIDGLVPRTTKHIRTLLHRPKPTKRTTLPSLGGSKASGRIRNRCEL